jgi:hypothetical protein
MATDSMPATTRSSGLVALRVVSVCSAPSIASPKRSQPSASWACPWAASLRISPGRQSRDLRRQNKMFARLHSRSTSKRDEVFAASCLLHTVCCRAERRCDGVRGEGWWAGCRSVGCRVAVALVRPVCALPPLCVIPWHYQYYQYYRYR